VHERQHLFASAEAAATVFDTLRALDPVYCRLKATVVMMDHIHGVFSLTDTPLADVMKRFRGASARRINSLLGRTGRVWQNAYFDRLLRPDDRLDHILSYMWFNPQCPGRNFRCERSIWEWFRPRICETPCPAWLAESGALSRE